MVTLTSHSLPLRAHVDHALLSSMCLLEQNNSGAVGPRLKKHAPQSKRPGTVGESWRRQ